ncbi:MAG: hypothetical protein IT260_08565 [Saprospiraceae bacterium]|nr:hypothetical protein [Saprospiraceae bacterium]
MRLFYSILMLLWGCMSPSVLGAQSGCTDPQASNYNPNATVNDGSCVYPVTNYTLTLKTALSTTINETSGLVMANGVVWTHNDSGNPAQIFKIDTLSNAILQTVNIGGASNVDWEDITFDGTHFYVGDFGNNANGNRTDLKIYKFPLSAIPSGSVVTVPAGQVQVINFSYEDQINFTPTGSNNTSFDCESLVYHDGELHLFSKDWVNHTCSHYTLPTTPGSYQAQNQETFFANGLVTGADISGEGVIMLLGYQSTGGPLFFWLLFDYPGGAFFSGNKRRIELGSFFVWGQAEGICLRNNGYGYVSNERVSVLVPARLYSFQISQWLQNAPLPIELLDFRAVATDAGVELHWSTATEQHNAGFVVERSVDGLGFSEMGFVPGAPDSWVLRSYAFLDAEPGRHRYYRLRQRDLDGSETLSPVVAVPAPAERPCRVVPQPLPAGQPLVLDGLLEGQALVLSDALGRVVFSGSALEQELPALAPGLYGLRVTGGVGCVGKVLVR